MQSGAAWRDLRIAVQAVKIRLGPGINLACGWITATIQVHTADFAGSGKDKPYPSCTASALLKGCFGVVEGGPGGQVVGLCIKSAIGPYGYLGRLAVSLCWLPQHPMPQFLQFSRQVRPNRRGWHSNRTLPLGEESAIHHG